jgi:hypothetical protein
LEIFNEGSNFDVDGGIILNCIKKQRVVGWINLA